MNVEGRRNKNKEACLGAVMMGEWDAVQVYAEGLEGGRKIEMKERVNESGIAKSSRVSEVEEGFNLVGNSTIHE